MNARILAKSETKARSRVCAYAFEPKDPPAEIQLWSVGENPTDYGVHVWSERSANEVMARYSERGNPLLIDVEHNGSQLEDGEPALTGGYARLELRDGAPWLRFEWSAYGVDQIASGQRRFLSPEYDIDPNTNEILKLYRVSLVADPGTYRARVLASAAPTKETQMDPTLSAIAAVINTVEDPAAAIATVKDLIAKMSADTAPETAPADPPSAGEPQPAFAGADDKPADEKKVAAKAGDAPKPVAAATKTAISTDGGASWSDKDKVIGTAPAGESDAVRASRENALKSENALRDILLEKSGHRLQPSIRTWASSQSLDVVRGLIAAAPEVQPAPAQVSATRGVGHGTGAVKAGLQGAELEDMQRQMGTFQASAPKKPYRNENGEFVLPTVTPTEFRKQKAADDAAKGAK